MAAATQAKHRRGGQNEVDVFTPAVAEIIYNSSEKELTVGDGITKGGVPIPKKSNVVLSFDTIDIAKLNSALKEGYTVEVEEHTAGNGGGGTWGVIATGTTPGVDLPNDIDIVLCGNVPTLSLKIRSQQYPGKAGFVSYLDASQLGAVGDYDFVLKTGTDNSIVVNRMIEITGKVGGEITFPAGAYKFTQQLNVHEGVRFRGLGTVGSVTQKGVSFVFESANGIVFDGNNGLSSTEGAEGGIEDIWVLKAPDSTDTGWGITCIVTDNSNKPGFLNFKNCHVVGATASQGEALWSRGWVFDGVQSSIGLKNVTAVNCGATGIKTANKYLDIINGVEMHFDNFYVRDGSSSYPSFGAAGITIDSDQGAVPAANAPSALLRFSNCLILGDISIGECASVYFSNSFAVGIMPTGVAGSGTTISWRGGELVNKYVDTASYTANIDCLNQQSRSDLSNQLRVTANVSLNKSHSGILITCPNATGNLTHALPNFLTTNMFDFTIINNGNFDVTIEKDAANSFFPKGCNLNGNITNVVIPAGAAATFKSGGINDAGVNVESIKGTITLTALGFMTDRGEVSRVQTLTGSLANRPREAHIFALDPGAASRIVSLSISSFIVGDSVTYLNTGTVNNLSFGIINILPGKSQIFHFNGVDFGEN